MKIADFGFCKILGKDPFTVTMLGSPIHMAPEVLDGNTYNSSCDMWSLGVITY